MGRTPQHMATDEIPMSHQRRSVSFHCMCQISVQIRLQRSRQGHVRSQGETTTRS